MRRVLRKLIAREYESIGDTSTLADPSVVEELKAKDALLGEIGIEAEEIARLRASGVLAPAPTAAP
jgi:hypothetical protein